MIFQDFNDKIISNFWLFFMIYKSQKRLDFQKLKHVSAKSTNHAEYETDLDFFQIELSISDHCDMPWDALNCHWTAKLLQPSAFACFEYFRRVQNCNLLTLLFFLVSYTPLHTHILCKFGWLMVRETVQTVSGCP